MHLFAIPRLIPIVSKRYNATNDYCTFNISQATIYYISKLELFYRIYIRYR